MRRLFLTAAAAVGLLAVFVLQFDPESLQWGVDALWLTALAVWAVSVWTVRERRDRWRIAHPWALATSVLLFCAAWLDGGADRGVGALGGVAGIADDIDARG